MMACSAATNRSPFLLLVFLLALGGLGAACGDSGDDTDAGTDAAVADAGVIDAGTDAGPPGTCSAAANVAVTLDLTAAGEGPLGFPNFQGNDGWPRTPRMLTLTSLSGSTMNFSAGGSERVGSFVTRDVDLGIEAQGIPAFVGGGTQGVIVAHCELERGAVDVVAATNTLTVAAVFKIPPSDVNATTTRDGLMTLEIPNSTIDLTIRPSCELIIPEENDDPCGLDPDFTQMFELAVDAGEAREVVVAPGEAELEIFRADESPGRLSQIANVRIRESPEYDGRTMGNGFLCAGDFELEVVAIVPAERVPTLENICEPL
jgi:hypothetical protein